MDSLDHDTLVLLNCFPNILAEMKPGKRYPSIVYKEKLVDLTNKYISDIVYNGHSKVDLPDKLINKLNLKRVNSCESLVYCVDNSVKDFKREIVKALVSMTKTDYLKILFVFPLIAESYSWDLRDVDLSLFKTMLKRSEGWTREDEEAIRVMSTVPDRWFYEQSYGMGWHTSSDFDVDDINNSCQAIQVYLSPPIQFKICYENVTQCLNKYHQLKVPIFVHAPYVINMAAARAIETECLINTLKQAHRIGASGVVVHVGKYLTMSYAEAWANSVKVLFEVLKYATPECPLLLETPAGQGTEMFTDISHFIIFCNSIWNDSFGICIDTCHVFSSGYCPLWYINEIQKRSKVPTRLIHFNDSKTKRGSRVDRHASPGTGYIGSKRLRAVYKRCEELNIPTVRE